MTPAPTDVDTTPATWPTNRLIPNPFNPRNSLEESGIRELAASIAEHGVIQPLVITPKGMVVAGHRRLAACKLARLAEVPVVIRDLTPKQQQEIMLVENLQRDDLSPIEEGRAYQRLLDGGYTTAQLARKIGFNSGRVHSRVSMLKLDPAVQDMFHSGDLAVTLSVPLCSVKDPAKQRRLATIALRRRLTSAQMQELIAASDPLRAPPRTVPAPPVDDGTLPPAEPADTASRPRSATRQEALDRLHENRSRVITFADVAAAFENVCCSCGLGDSPQICMACPLKEMIDKIEQAHA
jgi:ParB family chromosome partitioning protein